jgi:anti-sigma factor RsiW
MMSCRELVELITDYLEGSMPLRERMRVRLHLFLCDGCRAYLEQMRATVRATGALREEDVPAEARDALMAAFHGWKSRRGA